MTTQKMPGLRNLSKITQNFQDRRGWNASKEHSPLFGMWYTLLLFSKDYCKAGAGILLIATTAFLITQSLLTAKNRPLLHTEDLWTLWRH